MGNMWAAHYYGMGQNLNRIVGGVPKNKWDFVGAAWLSCLEYVWKPLIGTVK